MMTAHLFTDHGTVHPATLSPDPRDSGRSVAWVSGRAYRPGDLIDGRRIIGVDAAGETERGTLVTIFNAEALDLR
jgi:hypothetical protein